MTAEIPTASLPERLERTAFAFRGYNVTNLGRTPELLEHPAYGPLLEQFLKEARDIYSEVMPRPNNPHSGRSIQGALLSRLPWPARRQGKRLDLLERLRAGRESTLETYPEDVAMIIGVELAQLKILEEFFGVSFREAQLAFGYSLGEATAVIAGGIYDWHALLPPLITLAKDAAELARDVRLGILFSRGPALEMEAIQRTCTRITGEGRGMIAVSSYLSPNSVLLMGQGPTLDRFGETMYDELPESAHLRKNPHHWPPLHTPITWVKNIPNRAGVMLAAAPGGFTAPTPPILSMVTGTMAYNDYNSREILVDWVDHPQRVWDVVDKTLAAGVERVVHVGPQPNILPGTFNRLSNNVTLQLSGRSLGSLGRRAMSRIVRRHRPWLSNLLSARTTLLRAPFVEQIVLEDWLLEQDV